MFSNFCLNDVAVYTCEHISAHSPVPTRTMSFGPADELGWEKSLVGVAHLLDIADVIISESDNVICQLPPELYAGSNYCQSHMFWWTHGCQLLSHFRNFKMCLMT